MCSWDQISLQLGPFLDLQQNFQDLKKKKFKKLGPLLKSNSISSQNY
jgi:hypothetical protein